jgi:hypothetical protein
VTKVVYFCGGERQEGWANKLGFSWCPKCGKSLRVVLP